MRLAWSLKYSWQHTHTYWISNFQLTDWRLKSETISASYLFILCLVLYYWVTDDCRVYHMCYSVILSYNLLMNCCWKSHSIRFIHQRPTSIELFFFLVEFRMKTENGAIFVESATLFLWSIIVTRWESLLPDVKERLFVTDQIIESIFTFIAVTCHQCSTIAIIIFFLCCSSNRKWHSFEQMIAFNGFTELNRR